MSTAGRDLRTNGQNLVRALYHRTAYSATPSASHAPGTRTRSVDMYASASKWQFGGEIGTTYHGRQKEWERPQEYHPHTFVRERPVPNSERRNVALGRRLSWGEFPNALDLSVRGVLLQATRVNVLLGFLALHRGRAIKRRLRDIMIGLFHEL